MEQLFNTILAVKLPDIFDILLVALFFYTVFALLRQTRSSQALKGFIAFMICSLLLYLVALSLNFKAMILIFKDFLITVVLIFLIVFQSEFKKALTDLGQLRIFRPFLGKRRTGIVEEVVQAVTLMSRARTGGLIVFERNNSLSAYTVTGTQLDAIPSSELIRTIFVKRAPLHDGALIVVDDRLVAAGCILPMTDNPDLSRELGTRHRAAIALSEETDAVVVVVSEETGIVSLVAEGKIERRLQAEELQRRLRTMLNTDDGETEASNAPHEA